MVSLLMSPHTSLPQLLQEYFVIIIAVDNLQKLGTKKVTTWWHSWWLSLSSSLCLSLSLSQKVKLCSLILSLQNLSFYCPIGGSFFKSEEKQQLLRPLYCKKPKKISPRDVDNGKYLPFLVLDSVPSAYTGKNVLILYGMKI